MACCTSCSISSTLCRPAGTRLCSSCSFMPHRHCGKFLRNHGCCMICATLILQADYNLITSTMPYNIEGANAQKAQQEGACMLGLTKQHRSCRLHSQVQSNVHAVDMTICRSQPICKQCVVLLGVTMQSLPRRLHTMRTQNKSDRRHAQSPIK